MPLAILRRRLRLDYQRSFDSSTPILTESSLIPNADLKPEITGSYEFGLDLRFLQSRINLDLTYYDSATKNQIINIFEAFYFIL